MRYIDSFQFGSTFSLITILSTLQGGKSNQEERDAGLAGICNTIYKISEECDSFQFIFERLVTSPIAHHIISLFNSNEIKCSTAMAKMLLLLHTIVLSCDSDTEIGSILVEKPVFCLNKLMFSTWNSTQTDFYPAQIEISKILHLISSWWDHENAPIYNYNIPSLFANSSGLIDKILHSIEFASEEVVQTELIGCMCDLIKHYVQKINNDETYDENETSSQANGLSTKQVRVHLMYGCFAVLLI